MAANQSIHFTYTDSRDVYLWSKPQCSKRCSHHQDLHRSYSISHQENKPDRILSDIKVSKRKFACQAADSQIIALRCERYINDQDSTIILYISAYCEISAPLAMDVE